MFRAALPHYSAVRLASTCGIAYIPARRHRAGGGAAAKGLRELNEAFPARDKSSDGSIGDAAHRHHVSDHNPNAAGVMTAIDIDRDFNDGSDGRELVSALVAALDPRIKCVIFERQISVTGDITRWKPYHGQNAHNQHVHISVSANKTMENKEQPELGL